MKKSYLLVTALSLLLALGGGTVRAEACETAETTPVGKTELENASREIAARRGRDSTERTRRTTEPLSEKARARTHGKSAERRPGRAPDKTQGTTSMSAQEKMPD